MKYTLKVSYDCGVRYVAEKESDDLEELKQRGKELDREMLRWTIEDAEGKQVEYCNIHKSIVETILAQRLKGKRGND